MSPRTVPRALLVGAAASVIGSVSLPAASHADVFLLTSDHCTGGCGTPPFGQVSVTSPSSGMLDFAVTLFNSNKFVNTGFPLTFGFDLSSTPTITYSSLISGWSIPDAIPTNKQAAANPLYHQDGAGFYEYGVLWGQQGGGHGTSGPLSFEIAATGLTLASIVQNATGQFFATDIISGTNGNTGNVDASVRGVPGPIAGAGLPGLLAACSGLLMLATRRRNNLA
jgi:hypothetical protein